MPYDIDHTVLWNAVCNRFPDRRADTVSVRYVSVSEITDLNHRYRGKKSPTNVLTFSYTDDVPYEHDIALCSDIAEAEAKHRGVALRDYTALLLTHAMLHAAGLDHEQSVADNERMRTLEREIVSECGFAPVALKDVY